LGWASLKHIDPEAMPLLAGLFGSLCDEPVSLCFSGADRLVQTLRSITPSGDRTVSMDWWHVRLNALRSMHMHDDFELVALDYCVTFEVSPPAWEPARCDYSRVSAPHTGDTSHGAVWVSPAYTVPMGLDAGNAAQLELRGEILGDATQALANMGETGQAGDRVYVSCQGLVRVDFSAAGSILNWVAQRQNEGVSVQFRDVHRLVAAFFNVIGINEHARVSPRPM
jgi:ABC-type transporter Mla MlaB component